MASIDEIICREINPFDRETLVPGNFWQERQDAALAVNSIHEIEIKQQIEASLNSVRQDNISRTILLAGDSGSGKSYLLARLKNSFNDRAFFAYIGPWPDSNYIWRHTLRQTVESLLYKPEGKQESQLLLWLKGLSAFRSQGLAKKILGERRLFIKNLCDTYPTGIFNAKRFFGVLYDLTNPDLHHLACDWLRGEDLDRDDLKELNLKKSIENEEDAKNILGNFGRISADNRPIVLCFDQLDAIPRLANESLDFQSLFNINSTIHNQKYTFRNYLIIISVITNTWRRNYKQIQPADLASGRINKIISLKDINMQQAEALWTMRLHYIHTRGDRPDNSPLYPLSREQLKSKFPGGKTKPRNALVVGYELYQIHKDSICNYATIKDKDEEERRTSLEERFKSLWEKEYQKVRQKITKITVLSSPELVRVLCEVLTALEVSNIKEKLLTGKSDFYSFSYLHSQTKETIGIVWTEDANMTSFVHVMKASKKAIDRKNCHKVYLIRSGNVGDPKLKGNQIYRQIFFNSSHKHLKPNLSSLHLLATYYKLFLAAKNDDLTLGQENINLKQLQDLVRKSAVLNPCQLLQDLQIINVSDSETQLDRDRAVRAKEYLYNLVKTEHFLAKNTLIERTTSNFTDLKESQIDESILALCRENKIKFVNPKAKSEAQLICLVPQEDAV